MRESFSWLSCIALVVGIAGAGCSGEGSDAPDAGGQAGAGHSSAGRTGGAAPAGGRSAEPAGGGAILGGEAGLGGKVGLGEGGGGGAAAGASGGGTPVAGSSGGGGRGAAGEPPSAGGDANLGGTAALNGGAESNGSGGTEGFVETGGVVSLGGSGGGQAAGGQTGPSGTGGAADLGGTGGVAALLCQPGFVAANGTCNPVLRSLTLGGGGLSQTFDPLVTAYAASVNADSTRLEVSTEAEGAVIRINGTPRDSLDVTLSAAITPLSIAVTAGDRTTTYQVAVTRFGAQQACIKASNTGNSPMFGRSLAISADGNTLAVGATGENNAGTGVGNGTEAAGGAQDSGAVFVFRRADGAWEQEAYLKASNTGRSDNFGWSVALSGNGDTLAVGAHLEDSGEHGVASGTDQANASEDSGAVYVFSRKNGIWKQQGYLKAFENNANDEFGYSVALSKDGHTLAVGAHFEDGSGGNQAANPNPAIVTPKITNSGAVYVFGFAQDNWEQQAYLKASNAGVQDEFGSSVALSGDGRFLAVGAPSEDSAETGPVLGEDTADGAANSGSTYIFARTANGWEQAVSLKASNTGAGDHFGEALALDATGATLAIGAPREGSAETGVASGTDVADGAPYSGAVYVFARSGNLWVQSAALKASNTKRWDYFGASLGLSADGRTLAISAYQEDGAEQGLGVGNGTAGTVENSGAAYVFTLAGGDWGQKGYLKASNTDLWDYFGFSLALAQDGGTLAIGASAEDSAEKGVASGKDTENASTDAGAVYIKLL